MLEWKRSILIETILISLVCLLILVSNVLNIKFEESKEYIFGLGRVPGERNGYLLQYSGLENSMDYSPWGGRVRHDWVTFTFTSGKHEMVSSPKQVIEKCAHNECERREVCDHCREKASKCLQLWLDQVEYEGGNHTVLIKKCWQHLGGIQLSPSSSLVWQSSIHSKPMK